MSPSHVKALLGHVATLPAANKAQGRLTEAYRPMLSAEIAGQKVGGLLDSGNLWKSAISLAFYRSLPGRPRLSRPKFLHMETARSGAPIRVVGQLAQPLLLRVRGTDLQYHFRPIVLENLSMDLNLSGPWMRENRWDQLHSRGLVQVGPLRVPLLPFDSLHGTRPEGELPLASLAAAVHVSSRTVVPSRSWAMVPLKKSEDAAALPAYTGLFEEDKERCDRTGLVCHISALVHVPASIRDSFPVIVANFQDHPVTLRQGQTFGRVEWASAGPGVNTIASAAPVPAGKGADQWPEAKRREWLVREFRLKEKPCLREADNLERAVQLLLKYWTFFSHDGSYGKTHLLKHRIITDEVHPIKCKTRPVTPAYREDLRRQLDHLLEQDVIEPADSPWSANLVPVKKKNGSIRWCVDWRRLNSVTKKDAYPMPSVKECLSCLAGSRIFSGIDMQGAFHCIELDERDKEKTAFATPFGSFQQKRLGFGLTNGPSAYCRLVEKILRGIPSSVAIGFLDDGMIHSDTFDQHLKNLDRTLKAYQDAGLKLSPSKCHFFGDKVVFLGHEVSAEGVRPTDDHVRAVRDWPLPTLKTQIRGFLGTAGYYSEHIRDYAELAAPWTSAMGKTDKEDEKQPIEVTPEMKKNFEELKRRLVTKPVLGLPHFQGPMAGRFILDTDFCHLQISGILSQEQKGKEVVLSYGSKKLNSAQRDYYSYKGELFAGVEFMRRYRYYLQGQSFLWRTDHCSLRFVMTMKEPSSIISRWLNSLADFHFEVEHRPGKRHVNADALSRFSAGDPADPEGHEEEDRTLTLGSLRTEGGQASQGQLLDAQLRDTDLQHVRQWLLEGRTPTGPELKRLSSTAKKYAGVLSRLSLSSDGLLHYKTQEYDGARFRYTICLPKSLLEESILTAHHTGGHMAAEKTTLRLSRSVYFPGLRKEVEQQLDTCLECQTKDKGPRAQRHTLLDGRSGYPFQKVHIDYVGPLNPGDLTGARYLLTVRDSFSKWVEALPVKDSTTETTLQHLNKDFFARFGYPEQIHTDQGPQFMSHLFRAFCKDLNIKHTNTLAYNPKSNGQVERMHRDLAAIIRALTNAEESDGAWEVVLPQALFALRTTVSSATGLSPHQVLFGRDTAQPLDLLFGNPNRNMDEILSRPQYVRSLRRRQEAAQSYVRKNLAKAIVRQRRQYNQEKKHFHIGARVWLFDPRHDPSRSRKFAHVYSGPWVVSSSPDNHELYVRIEPDPGWATRKHKGGLVSIDRLKPYTSTRVVPGSLRPQQDEDEFAEFTPLPKKKRRRDFSDSEDDSDTGFQPGPPGPLGAPAPAEAARPAPPSDPIDRESSGEDTSNDEDDGGPSPGAGAVPRSEREETPPSNTGSGQESGAPGTSSTPEFEMRDEFLDDGLVTQTRLSRTPMDRTLSLRDFPPVAPWNNSTPEGPPSSQRPPRPTSKRRVVHSTERPPLSPQVRRRRLFEDSRQSTSSEEGPTRVGTPTPSAPPVPEETPRGDSPLTQRLRQGRERVTGTGLRHPLEAPGGADGPSAGQQEPEGFGARPRVARTPVERRTERALPSLGPAAFRAAPRVARSPMEPARAPEPGVRERGAPSGRRGAARVRGRGVRGRPPLTDPSFRGPTQRQLVAQGAQRNPPRRSERPAPGRGFSYREKGSDDS